jgi:hypothetical protein
MLQHRNTCRLWRALATSRLAHSAPNLLSVEAAAAELALALSAGGVLSAPLAPGTWLRLLLPQCAASVAVHSGPPGIAHVAVSGGGALRIAADARGASVSVADGGASLGALSVWLPERFASLQLLSGGAASLDRLTEGAAVLAVRGPLTLGTLRCTQLHARTRGGDVRADALQGEAVGISTAGGALVARRVLGRRVALLSGGGAVALQSVFVERLQLRSGGGAAQLGALRVGARARLCSAGGPLRVRSLDGERGATAAAVSGGGELEVGLLSAAEAMAALSLSAAPGPGPLRLWLPPGWRAPPRLRDGGCAPLPAPAAAAGGRKAAAAQPPAGARQAWLVDDAAARLGGGAVLELDAGDGGSLELTERSWIEGALSDAALRALRGV